MEPYFTFQRGRRTQWKGHATAKNVRNVIRTAQRYSRDLRVFATGQEDGWVTYTEVPAAEWPTRFPED